MTGPNGSWRRFTLATVVAGVVAAAAEMVIVLPVQGRLGASPARVFQFIASGVLGKAAFAAGAAGVLLGVAAHVLISLIIAGIYVAALARWSALRRRPGLGGAVLGLVTYGVMTFAVVPLSRIGPQPAPSAPLGAVSLLVHIFAFGLPLSVTATALWRRLGALAGQAVGETAP